MKISELLIEGFKEAKAEFSKLSVDADAVIAQYRELVNKNQVSGQEKNIDYWRKQGWEAFNQFVQELSSRPTKTKVKGKKAEGKSAIVEETPEWLIVVPLDHNASCYYGRKTSWCTAKPEQPYFKAYINKGVLLIYCLRSDGTRWAIAVGEGDGVELFDQDDNKLSEANFEAKTGLIVQDVISKAKNTPEWKAKDVLGSVIRARFQKLSPTFSFNNLGSNVLPRDLELEKNLLDTADIGLIGGYFRTISSSVINEVGPKFRLLALLGNHYLLKSLINISEYEQEVLVKDEWSAIEYMKNPSYKLQELALLRVEKDPRSFSKLLTYCGYDQSPKVQIAAIKYDVYNIEYIYNPTKEVKDYIQKYRPDLVDDIADPRDHLLSVIAERESSLDWLRTQYENAAADLKQFEDGINANELPPEALPSIQEFMAQKTKAVNDAKLNYDKLAQEIKWYQDQLAKLPIQENHELARILYLSAL